MENKTYEIEIDGRIIPVTTKEVLDFYPKEYHLTEDDIRQYAAIYTARIKCYREYDGPLDAAYIRRLLDEERLMKNGESDGFRLQLDFRWYVELRKEDGPRHRGLLLGQYPIFLTSVRQHGKGTAALPERIQ